MSVDSADDTGSTVGSVLSEMGPTWIAGAIAAGPATMASLLTGGAGFGYDLLWVVVLSAILGAFAQYLASRLGLLTEAGIVAVVEEHLGELWAWVLVADVVLAAGLAQLVIMKTLADVSATITGVDARIWGVTWAVVLAAGLAGGGYRFLEWGAKLLVLAVVAAFVGSLFVVPIDPVAAAGGLLPTLPDGADAPLVAAGILGGAVHITLVTMQSYTMRARGWTRDDEGLARVDVGASMLVAFGVYSLAIYLVAASVLTPEALEGGNAAINAGQALGPLVGPNAKWLFLIGLWGAAVSTLGGNTVVPPFLVADKLGWGTTTEDGRYRALLAGTALVSGAGAFLGGSFFPLLVLVLAFGLVGTPFAIAVVLYLLNDPDAVPGGTPTWQNAGGLVLIAVASYLAVDTLQRRFDQLGYDDPVTLFGAAFAAVLAVATVGLAVRFVRERQRRSSAPA